MHVLKFLKTHLLTLIMQQLELYPFCVEPINVLEVFINQGVVTFNLIFKKCPRTFVHGGLYHKGFNQGPRPPLPPPCPSLVNPH